MWFKVTLILLILAGLWAGAIYGHRLMILIDGDNPHPVAVNATIERRLHLTVDTGWDDNHRRKFECREVKP
jgi:hypothetical protein